MGTNVSNAVQVRISEYVSLSNSMLENADKAAELSDHPCCEQYLIRAQVYATLALATATQHHNYLDGKG